MNMMISQEFLNDNMMGPNALMLADEVASSLNLQPGMRVLDLACGTGLTSIHLARRYGVEIVAMDLWIAAEDNRQRFAQFGLEQQITALHQDVNDLPRDRPFPEDHFDALISIDAWHYFGASSSFFDTHLVPFLKPGARVAVVVPGLKAPFNDGVPPEMAPYWQSGMNFFTVDWWRQLWQQSAFLRMDLCAESGVNDAAWQSWLGCNHPYAIRDRAMMAAEAGRYFNFTRMTGRIDK